MFWRVSFDEEVSLWSAENLEKVLVGVLKPKLGSFIIAMTLSEEFDAFLWIPGMSWLV